MGISEVIAALAVAVSLLALGISYVSYRHTVRVSEEQSRLAFSREKSEFLVRIDKARAEFDRLGERLKDLLTAMEHAPNKSRELLSAEAAQLESDLEYLGGCERQVWSLYDETYNMNQMGLVHHRPQFLNLIEKDEQFARDAHLRCDRIDQAIAKVAAKNEI